MENSNECDFSLNIGESLIITKVDRDKFLVNIEIKRHGIYKVVRHFGDVGCFISADILRNILNEIKERIIP